MKFGSILVSFVILLIIITDVTGRGIPEAQILRRAKAAAEKQKQRLNQASPELQNQFTHQLKKSAERVKNKKRERSEKKRLYRKKKQNLYKFK